MSPFFKIRNKIRVNSDDPDPLIGFKVRGEVSNAPVERFLGGGVSEKKGGSQKFLTPKISAPNKPIFLKFFPRVPQGFTIVPTKYGGPYQFLSRSFFRFCFHRLPRLWGEKTISGVTKVTPSHFQYTESALSWPDAGRRVESNAVETVEIGGELYFWRISKVS